MALPIKYLILKHPDMKPNQGSLIDEVSIEEFEEIIKDYEDYEYPKGIPEVWVREGEGFRIFPTIKDSPEFEQSGYKLAIIRETEN